MSPDPKTVREIAQDALVVAIRRGATGAVETALIAHGVGGPVVGEKFDVYTNAVAAEYDRRAAALARPDEQQPADVVTAEQQQDGAVDLRERVRAWMDGRTDTIDRDDVREIYVVADRASRDLAGAIGELRRVLAERTALAARVAELEAHPWQMVRADREADEADVRAVAAVLELGNVSFHGAWLTDWDDARGELEARFADRIAALDADTDGGAK